jgi:threonylcarbamoyladenosine tRNA methylthiotransferase CDKAL1
MHCVCAVEDFECLCDSLLKRVPGLTICTDIICGFPGESDEDFAATMRLVKKYSFLALNISQFVRVE